MILKSDKNIFEEANISHSHMRLSDKTLMCKRRVLPDAVCVRAQIGIGGDNDDATVLSHFSSG